MRRRINRIIFMTQRAKTNTYLFMDVFSKKIIKSNHLVIVLALQHFAADILFKHGFIAENSFITLYFCELIYYDT